MSSGLDSLPAGAGGLETRRKGCGDLRDRCGGRVAEGLSGQGAEGQAWRRWQDSQKGEGAEEVSSGGKGKR